MPEMLFTVRWPDKSVSECYSPSLVIKDYLEVGSSYSVAEFVDRSRTALNIASERVRAKYGYACSSAMDQLQKIESTASRFAGVENALVAVEAFKP
jgi:uncharacterized repeat protein (TIGR04042 family)